MPKITISNYKILKTLFAAIVGILIAFYYSYAQPKNQMVFLEQEKSLLLKDLTLMKAEVKRLSGLNEVNKIELQMSRFRIQEFLDSNMAVIQDSASTIFVMQLRFLKGRHQKELTSSMYLRVKDY